MATTKKPTLREEVEAEMAAEEREVKKASIKALLRKKIALEQSGKTAAEDNKAAIAKIDQEIADIESGKKK
jgi:hypothetical protein